MNSQVPSIESPIPTRCDDSSKKMKIEIYVQTSMNRILLAHCSEDFIDFLLSLLIIPLGKVISLLNKNHESTLCIENMHQSVVELNVREYLRSHRVKGKLLNPKLSKHYLGSSHIFPLEGKANSNNTKETFYTLGVERNCKFHLPNFKTSNCFKELIDVSPKLEGYVRGPTKFVLTDDFVCFSIITMSCFTYHSGYHSESRVILMNR